MIDERITRKHIIEAIKEIDKNGLPSERRKSRYHFLLFKNKEYPPKYTISLAARFAIDRELGIDDLYAGNQSNKFLESRGFKIIHSERPKSPNDIEL
jgi:hypothetical protein